MTTASALAINWATFAFLSLFDDRRVHAFGCTFILHQWREIVVRTPADRLISIGAVARLNPNAIWLPCTMCVAAWTAWMFVRARAERRTHRSRQPRGFPLD